jgi:two-component system, NarL family, sensor histidine kinase LiaS
MPLNIRPLRRLQWQLSLSYTLVAVGALLVVEILLLAGIIFMINSDALSGILVRTLREQMSAQLRPYLDRPVPDIEGMNRFLNAYSDPTEAAEEELPRTQFWTVQDANQNMVVLDPQGNLLWSQYPVSGMQSGQYFDPALISGLERVLPAAQANERSPASLYTRVGEQMIMAVPVESLVDQRVLGIIVFELEMPSITNPNFIIQLLPTILVSIIVFTLAAGLVGSVFGFFTARRLTRRLTSVSTAADAWSRGDFSIFIRDSMDDEMGELARRLNTMAEQLQNLMDTRRDLAALEERNRIARELHDSVKQQVFAASMQLGAARAMLPDSATTAGERLAEAERLTKQAQSELTTLIHELRPVALEGKGLIRALREMTAEWSRQNGIAAQFHSPPELTLPLLKEQAVFRVVQEALANIARHSHAQAVEITIYRTEGQLRLEVNDDGRGFEPSAASENKGIGLRSMRERVEALSGRMEIQAAPGKGTRLLLFIPL